MHPGPPAGGGFPGGHALAGTGVSHGAPSNPSPTGAVRIALCFGVNEVDASFYGGTFPLDACENDASAMASLLTALGFETQKYLTREANSATLMREIKNASKRLKANDILVITYAGHGSTTDDLNGDEKPKNEDQTWCLHDRMVIDDELAEAWTQFNEGVLIFVVADSCHSGTSTRAIGRGHNPLNKSEGARDLAGLSSTTKVRTLPKDGRNRAVAIQEPKFGDHWRTIRGGAESANDTKATGLLLAGCDDDETSGESGDHGHFTRALLAVVNSGKFTGTFRELINLASEKIPDPNQHPKMFQFGALNSKIENAKPFVQ